MRTFIAVEVDEKLREKMAELQKQLALEGVKLVERDNLHLTLHFLGEINEEMKDKVIQAMDKLNYKPIEMVCKGVGAFPSRNSIRVVWVGAEVPELKNIHEQLSEELSKLGFEPEEFSPHITLARVKFPKEKEKLKRFIQEHEQLELGKCTITGVFLKKSMLTPKGPVYGNVHEKSFL